MKVAEQDDCALTPMSETELMRALSDLLYDMITRKAWLGDPEAHGPSCICPYCRALAVLDRRSPEGGGSDPIREEMARALEAMGFGGDPVDEKIGWMASWPKPRTIDHFKCEFCGAEHLDCTLIEHAPDCAVPLARAALSKHRDRSPPAPSQEGASDTGEQVRSERERTSEYLSSERRRGHNDRVLERIHGMPAQLGTPASDTDPTNPNARPQGTDIVERLRNCRWPLKIEGGRSGAWTATSEICAEAAAEIERLRALMPPYSEGGASEPPPNPR